MYVATLIANSNNKNLSALILKQVVKDLGGTQYNVLDDNIAVDIPLRSKPINPKSTGSKKFMIKT